VTRRVDRVQELLRAEAGRLLMLELAGTGTPLFSITRVRVSPDLSVADIFFIPVDASVSPGAVLNGAKHALPKVQRALAQELSMFRVPHLRLRVDKGLQYEQHIEELLRKANVKPGDDHPAGRSV